LYPEGISEIKRLINDLKLKVSTVDIEIEIMSFHNTRVQSSELGTFVLWISILMLDIHDLVHLLIDLIFILYGIRTKGALIRG